MVRYRLHKDSGIFCKRAPHRNIFATDFDETGKKDYLCHMDLPHRYTAEDFTATLPADDYIARFRDAERIAEYCRSCPNYGRSWGCPPFEFRVEEYLAGYDSVLLVATKITPQTRDLPITDATALIRPERIRLERRLLEMERLHNGRSFAYVGTCLYCPAGTCTRPDGKPCRHPEWVWPSLEACGFDIARTTSELFGLELKWGTDGHMPEYLVLVCGFFHHNGKVVWNG